LLEYAKTAIVLPARKVMADGGAAIEVHDLVYEYPAVRALRGVSLSVAPHTITALVGPNGAGKTTLLRCIAALETPYSGWITVGGVNVQKAPRKVHRLLGFLPDFFGLYDDLTVEQCLIFAARSHGVPGHDESAAVKRTAEQVGLADRMGTRAGELSRGLRQRLAIGQSMVHEPQVLILDEPAAGLDPQARRDLSQLLLQIKARGVTQIVSSHILAELEDYSDQMVIIDEGLVRGGGAIEIRADTSIIRIRIELATPNADLAAALQGRAGITLVSSSDSAAIVTMAQDAHGRAALLASLIGGGFRVAAFVPSTRRLEDAYFEQAAEA
jgi:ABC-2 type transport system ATP-binding protein